MNNKITCSVIGPKGYTGLELVKILLAHPQVTLRYLVSQDNEKLPLSKFLPDIKAAVNYQIGPEDLSKVAEESDVVFLALPHRVAMDYAGKLLNGKTVVIDLSGDFRFKKISIYEKWYGEKHRAKALLREAVYSVPELHGKTLAGATLISNPGCYPTGALLGIAPLLAAGLVKPSIIIDAKSGVSGAGKKSGYANDAGEIAEAVKTNFMAYKVNKHQHAPEIAEYLSAYTRKDLSLVFVPHLLPIFRGLVSTIYLEPMPSVTEAKIKTAYAKFYKGRKFIRFKDPGTSPQVKDVAFTNFCDISFTLDKKQGRLIVITAIDNLQKGASGQAVQNMNIRFGFPEEAGLLS